MKKTIPAQIVLLGVLLSVVLSQPASAQRYTITDLGTVGGSYSTAFSINDLGQVVGLSYIAFNAKDPSGVRIEHAFIWDKDSGMQDLGTLGESHSGARGINNSGSVVGRFSIGEYYNPLHAFIWNREEGMQDLGTFGGKQSVAVEINNIGEVLGTIHVTDYSGYSFIWTAEQGIKNLRDEGLVAEGVNDVGQVVGRTLDASPYYHAVLWDSQNGIQDIEEPDGFYGSVAHDINNSGEVVGSVHHQRSDGSVEIHGFVWDAQNGMQIIASLGGNVSVITSINDHGQVVGYYYYPDDPNDYYVHGFLYSDGEMKDLNDLLPSNSPLEVRYANDINNAGHIVGDANGHAFLMTPILEVDIDIKPGDDANCINLNGRGVIPVAIFGSPELDVHDIDVATLSLQGLSLKMVGKAGRLLVHFDDIDGDGYIDLIAQFQDSDGWTSRGDGYATLTGQLFDETFIQGSDTICIVP